MMNSNLPHTRQQGFTLVEVLVAMVILIVGILSMATMHMAAIRGNASANRMSIGSAWATDQIEQLLANDYDALIDADGDGSGGLDNTIDIDNNLSADGFVTSPDNDFTIYQNVADDYPIDNTKTIRVLVVSTLQGQTKTVTMTYIKAQADR